MDRRIVAKFGHDRSTRKKYWFLINNIPYPFSWQELKDVFRGAVSYPGYVETPFFPEGRANGFSWMIAHGESDADLVFMFFKDLLIRNNRVSVHVYDIQKYARLLRCNCIAGENGIIHTEFPAVLGQELVNSRITRIFMSQETYYAQLPSVASFIPINATTISIRVLDNSFPSAPQAQMYLTARPENGRILVPTSSATKRLPLIGPAAKREATTPRCSVDEEPRCINIYQVDDSSSDDNFESLLKQQGDLIKFIRNRSYGTGTGKALAIYQSSLEADHAAKQLIREKWGRFPLLVKRPRTIVRPVIVNGSG